MPNHITRFSGCQTKSPDSVVAKPNQKIPKMPRQIIMFKRCPTKPPDSGVVDTGNDTGEQLSARNRRLIYCQWQEQGRHGGGELPKLKGINRRYLRPSKSDTAAGGVIGTAMKSCIHRHPTHPDQRSLRPPKLKIAVLVWSSFGGLRGLWSGCMMCLCAFSWRFQWQYRWPWPTSAAGDIAIS